MSRVGALALVVCGLLATGLALFDATVAALALPPLVYLVVGALLRPSRIDLAIEGRTTPSLAMPGELISVEIGVQNRGGRLEEVELEDTVPPGLSLTRGASRSLGSLGSGAVARLAYQMVAQTGLRFFPGARAVARDPFGLFESVRFLAAERSLLVRPTVRKLRRLYLRPSRVGALAGPYSARVGGSGTEFFGIRGYAPGDPWRWIDWKHSARFPGRLFTKVFEQERMAEIGLILDARAGANVEGGPPSAFPYSVQAAASLADLLLQQGNRVGLLVYGGHLDWTLALSGKVQRERILRALARASLGHSQVFEQLRNLPSRLFPPDTQLILLSPLLRGDVTDLIGLRARHFPLLVISPDQVGLEARFLDGGASTATALRLARVEQAAVSRRLAQAGIVRVLWDTLLPFEELIERELSRPAPWLATIGARR
jgi:uncharacterized protein (DUF58 family)